ncbi:MAG: tetratricopeptide repeat protein [Deltaproteobacteria bacterium]|nr:tetratricopeptide repeat protein [Deltaproteobacteria bacterium]
MFSFLFSIFFVIQTVPVTKVLKRAQELEKKGEIEAAIVNYEKVLESDTSNITAIKKLGVLYLLKGMNKKARDRYEKITLLNPKISISWYILAYSQKKTGDCKKSVSSYRRYINMEPLDPDPWYNLGLCYETLGNLKSALNALNTYLSMQKNNSEKNWTEKARKALIRIKSRISHDGVKKDECNSYAEIAYKNAIKQYQKGDKVKAVKYLNSALSSCPSHINSLTGMVSLTIEMNICSQTLGHIVKGLLYHPRHKVLLYANAWCERQNGRYKIAAGIYKTYLKYYPGDPDVLFGIAETMRLSGKNSEGIYYYQAYLKNEVRKGQEKWKKLASEYIATLKKEITDSRPETPVVSPPATSTQKKITEMIDKKMFKEVEQFLIQALKVKKDDAFLLGFLSWVYYEKGNYKKAIEVSEKSRDSDALNPVPARICAMANLKLRNKKEALSCINKYLILAKDNNSESKYIKTLVGIRDVLTQ